MRANTSVSPQVQQVLAVGVPIAAMVISLAVVYPAWGRYGEAAQKAHELQQELTVLQNTPLPPRDPQVPAVDDGPKESAQFLGQIVALSLAPRCRFTGMETKPTSSATASGTLKAVRSKVEVEGVYPQVRQFLAEIRNSPRLFVVTGMEINTQASNAAGAQQYGGNPGVRAAVDIERYVVPVNAPANNATDAGAAQGTAAPVPMAGTGGSGASPTGGDVAGTVPRANIPTPAGLPPVGPTPAKH